MKEKARPKVPVSERALIARINRRLDKDDQKLCKARPSKVHFYGLGQYYIVDVSQNFIVDKGLFPCDLVAMAREMGVLKPYEVVVDDEGRVLCEEDDGEAGA